MAEVSSPEAAIWRSLIPVRVVIQSSLVSTILASSALVSTRSGRYPPHPFTTVRSKATQNPNLALSRAIELELGMETGDVAGKPFHHAARGHVVGRVDGAR